MAIEDIATKYKLPVEIYTDGEDLMHDPSNMDEDLPWEHDDIIGVYKIVAVKRVVRKAAIEDVPDA
jgi:hypothetical protein